MLRKLARVTFNVLTALSLMLCVGVLVLWLASYQRTDVLYRADGRSGTLIVSASGEILYVRVHPAAWQRRPPSVGWRWRRLPADGAGSAVVRVMNEAKIVGPASGRSPPYWLLAVMAALPAAARLTAVLARRRRRRRLLALGLCSACGYDLRATPGRCPECGAAGL